MGVQYQLFTAVPARGINGKDTNSFVSARPITKVTVYLKDTGANVKETNATILDKKSEPLPVPQNAGIGIVALDIGGISTLAGVYLYLFYRMLTDKIMPTPKPKGKPASI
jgi:hypothetical protein